MKVDSVFIANVLSEEHRALLYQIQKIESKNLYFNSCATSFINYLFSSILMLNSTPIEFLTKVGIITARKQFLDGLKYSTDTLGAKIVLLAASTKRLFGKCIEERVLQDGALDSNGNTLRELYPDILFTNGDNGTSVVLNLEIDSVLNKSNLAPNHTAESGRIIINGLGLLGLDALEHLLACGYSDEQVIVISNFTKDLKELVGERKIKIYGHIKEIDDKLPIKAIINCTHNPKNVIDAETIIHIQQDNKIYVIDVAVPYGFPEEEYLKCSNVERQDGGNAYIAEGLEFYFNPELCGLTDNVFYGCFAETLALSAFVTQVPANNK